MKHHCIKLDCINHLVSIALKTRYSTIVSSFHRIMTGIKSVVCLTRGGRCSQREACVVFDAAIFEGWSKLYVYGIYSVCFAGREPRTLSYTVYILYIGLARSVCQVFKHRICVFYTYAPCTLALWHALLLTLKGSLFPAAFHTPPPPFMHFSLHTSPSTPSVASLTITGSSQLQNGCGLKLPNNKWQEYGACTEIRRVLPYIRRINTFIRKYGIRIRRGRAGKYGVYTIPYNTYNYTNTDLANPTHQPKSPSEPKPSKSDFTRMLLAINSS